MALSNAHNSPLYSVKNQRLISGEAEWRGSCQTGLTSSEASSSSNPPIPGNQIRVPAKGGLKTREPFIISPRFGLNVNENPKFGGLDPGAQQKDVENLFNVGHYDIEPTPSVNEINTVINTFESLQNITPSMQNLVRTEDRYGKATFTDVSLRYKLIEEDRVEPRIWNLIENGCPPVESGNDTPKVGEEHTLPIKDHAIRTVNVVDCPLVPDETVDQVPACAGGHEQVSVPEGLFLEDSQSFYMGNGSFQTLDKNSSEYNTAYNKAKRLYNYCNSVGINHCISHIGYGWFYVGLDKVCPQALKKAGYKFIVKKQC